MLINGLRGGILTLFTILRHIWPYFGVKKSKTGVMNEAKISFYLQTGDAICYLCTCKQQV